MAPRSSMVLILTLTEEVASTANADGIDEPLELPPEAVFDELIDGLGALAYVDLTSYGDREMTLRKCDHGTCKTITATALNVSGIPYSIVELPRSGAERASFAVTSTEGLRADGREAL
jgi:hypothetical protein